MEYIRAKNEDFEQLVAIRIKAMQPSLERVGRFDLNRARKRFLKSFNPKNTIIAREKEVIVGFYMISEADNEMFLNHLYVDPAFQGSGIGSKFINKVKDLAADRKKEIKLEALKESRSNSFYISHGFIKINESEFDNIYVWKDF